MNIKIDKDILLNKFITPISKGISKCVLYQYFQIAFKSLVTTKEANPVLYANVKTPCDIGNKEEVTLNIPDVNKMTRMLNCINSDTIELEVNSNNIAYKSPNMSFKYHMLEDGVIPKSPVNVDKIEGLEFDSNFVISEDIISDIGRGSSFATDSNKLYFYMKDKKVYAELTNKEIANTDSVSYFITDTYNDSEIKKPMLIDLEIFKMFNGLKAKAVTKVNTKTRVMMFTFKDTDYTLQYIVAPLKR